MLPNLFVKRTLRQHEWDKRRANSVSYTLTPSASIPQRYRKDVAIQQYLREHTDIPVPSFSQTFEDDGAMYFASQFVDGVMMRELPEDDKKIVQKELDRHL